MTFLQLLRKDFRLNLVIVYGAIVLSVMPYVLGLANAFLFPPRYREYGFRDYLEVAQTAGFVGLIIVVLLAAAFGGLALAGERRDRTAEFLGMLPVSRGKVMLSKLAIAIACIVFFTVLHTLAIGFVNGWASAGGVRLQGAKVLQAGTVAFSMSMVLLGIGWAMSVFLRSPAISACVAIVVGVGVFFGGGYWVAQLMDHFPELRQVEEEVILAASCLALIVFGAIFAGLTSIHYLRRVEP